jgi:hypothetical protein
MRWLRDPQLLLLRELSVAPALFDALRQRTGLTQAQLARDLASLYFAGAITTTADRAGVAGFGAAERNSTGPGSPGVAREPESGDRAYPAMTSDLTAPAQLGLK